MNHSRFFSIFIAAALLLYGALGFYLMPLATFQGGLTRMSLLPERMFGWTQPQPALAPEYLQQSSLQEADILVIGDSFSVGRQWQTTLTKTGLKVRTEHWHSFDDKICADIEPWLRAQGFAGKYVVLEIVELYAPSYLQSSSTCAHMQYHPDSQADLPPVTPAVSFDTKHGDYRGKLSIGYRSLFKSLQYANVRQSGYSGVWAASKDVNVIPVAAGCELFSHARCSDALFLNWDKQSEPDDSAVSNVKRLNGLFNHITPIWAFVPNKTTAYLSPQSNFWNKIEHQVKAPNLLRMTQQAIQNKTVDLYFGNDTHFSTTGYLLMGNEILTSLQASESGTSIALP